MKTTALLVIDAQNDFHDDFVNAALPVPGSGQDILRIADFIRKINPTSIVASMDSHYALDISHPSWWENADGTIVSPFTQILAEDIKSGKYVPRIQPKMSLEYVESLERDGEFNHFIWPEHCLIGTPGQNFHPAFQEVCSEWMTKNLKWINIITKGTNPFTEHFGIFRANVPLPTDPTTDINQAVFSTLNQHDEIYLAGQARSHCVANSLKQLLEVAPYLAPKLTILEDGMSDVTGLPADFYVMMNKIYERAEAAGVRFEKIVNL